YGARRQPDCGPSDAVRDWLDLTLARWAIHDGKPVLGVCRGIQALNVACGGGLYQDLDHDTRSGIKHDYFCTSAFHPGRLSHGVRILGRSRLAAVLGSQAVEVNSRHHQGLRQLGRGLTATAFAPDDLIEAVEGANGAYLVGVQWHPEDLTEACPAMQRLF